LTCSILLAASVQAQSPPPASPSAEEILDKNIEALGGRAALESVKTVVMKGVKDRKGGSLLVNGQLVTTATGKEQDSVESYWKAGKNLLILNAGTKNEMRGGTGDGVSWWLFQGEVTTAQIPRPSTPFASYFDFGQLATAIYQGESQGD